MPNTKIIEFISPQKYKYVSMLGNGACGETIKIFDDEIECCFVAKKYKPIISKSENPKLFRELLRRFKDEAKLLFRLNHPNVVRIFNFFDFSHVDTGYIIMEFVEGKNIFEHIIENPTSASRVFEQVISGFAHLEEKKILHRDIRPANVIVTDSGVPKIIDFGFGKTHLDSTSELEKSISLNWWCAVPPEFAKNQYDFQTELFFVGKLFEEVIQRCELSEFKYLSLVRQMCEVNREKRTSSFASILSEVSEKRFREIDFSNTEIRTYRRFSISLSELFSSIDDDAVYAKNTSRILGSLEDLYRKTMLEEFIPDVVKLSRIFVSGSYRYRNRTEIKVDDLKMFNEMMSSFSTEKRDIVFQNLFSKLDAVEREQKSYSLDDEIPF